MAQKTRFKIMRTLERLGIVAERKTAGFFKVESEATSGFPVETERPANYENYLRAYTKLPWLYAGATKLAIAAVKPPLRVYERIKENGKEKRRVVERRPINDLLETPNPFLSWRELIQITIINLAINGEQFINLVPRGNPPITRTNPPVEMMWMKPFAIEVYADAKNYVSKYVYRTGATPYTLDPSEIVHIRQANPLSYWRGLGAMSAAENSAILELQAVTFNKNFLKNDATPAGIIETPDKLTELEVKTHRRVWDETHKGSGKGGKIGYMWGGMKFHEVGTKPKDAQYIEMRKMNREEQLAALGVPPAIVGLLEYANYSNMEVQSRDFWENAVVPLLDLIADKLTLQLSPLFDPNYIVAFDYSGIKILQEDEERKTRVATGLIQNGIKTPNQIIREMYGGEGYAGGNVYYMPMSALPVGFDESDGPPPEDLAAGENGDGEKSKTPKTLRSTTRGLRDGVSFWATPERKELLWKAFEKRTDAKARRMEPLVQHWLKKQGYSAAARARKAQQPAELSAGKLLNEDEEITSYRKRFERLYQEFFLKAAQTGLKQTKGILWDPDEKSILSDTRQDDEFNFTEIHKIKIEEMVMSAGSEITMTSKAAITKIIQEGLQEGWTVEKIAQEIAAKCEQLSYSRSRLVSKTEMCEVENFGLLEGYKANPEVELKGWVCAFVEKSRQGHMDADRKYNDEPIALSENFHVQAPNGEIQEMMFPGDASQGATPDNFCYCYCTIFPEVRNL